MAWRDLQNGSKQIHNRLKNIFIRPIIRADLRSAEELEAAQREARFQFLLVKNANQWWRMTNAERTELQSEIAARAVAYRDKFHDEQGYSFFMRQLDKLVNPAWSGMGNMDDLLMLIGGVAPALRSPTPKLPLNTRPDIVSVSPAPAVPTQPLRPRVEPGIHKPPIIGPIRPYHEARKHEFQAMRTITLIHHSGVMTQII